MTGYIGNGRAFSAIQTDSLNFQNYHALEITTTDNMVLPVTHNVILITAGGDHAITLPAGTPGQMIVVTTVSVAAGEIDITFQGYGTATFNNASDTATMLYTSGDRWIATSVLGVGFA